MRRIQTMEARFWAKVQKTSDCWLWTGGKSSGYGVLTKPKNAGKVYAHRYSYELHFGPFDPTLLVCHTCDNPFCVRPDHLFLGDQTANMRDMTSKGRGKSGMTQCSRGHDFSPDNTGLNPGGQRFCRTCRRASARSRYSRAKVSA
jgi:hypothetical protein